MNIFISWSGERSKEMAEALRVWLPRVIQSVRPWVSSHNVGKGSKWSTVLSSELGAHVYGIICVTPENRDKPWILFEAGALSKTDASRTYTLLLGLGPADIEQPLAQFNHTLAEESDIRSLVQSINDAGEATLSDEILNHAFETNWPFLKERLDAIRAAGTPATAILETAPGRRDERSLLEEILQLMRAQNSTFKPTQESFQKETLDVINGSVKSIVESTLESLGHSARVTSRLSPAGDSEVGIHLASGDFVEITFPAYSSLSAMRAIIRSGLDRLLAKGK